MGGRERQSYKVNCRLPRGPRRLTPFFTPRTPPGRPGERRPTREPLAAEFAAQPCRLASRRRRRCRSCRSCSTSATGRRGDADRVRAEGVHGEQAGGGWKAGRRASTSGSRPAHSGRTRADERRDARDVARVLLHAPRAAQEGARHVPGAARRRRHRHDDLPVPGVLLPGWAGSPTRRRRRSRAACALQNRLLFHISHRLNDENKLMGFRKLQDSTTDQLSLASIHYLHNHYQERPTSTSGCSSRTATSPRSTSSSPSATTSSTTTTSVSRSSPRLQARNCRAIRRNPVQFCCVL